MAEPTPENPATVNDSAIQAQVSTFLRDMGVVVGFVTFLAGCVKTRDIAGAVAYLQSAPAISALGVILSLGIMLWRQIHARTTVTNITAAVTNPGSVELASQKGPAA
jgi:hypothetical protein